MLNKRQKGSVLIVEDNLYHWIILQKFFQLTLPDVPITWVRSDQATAEYLNDNAGQGRPAPSLILLDLYLPKRENGLQLLWQLKSKAAPCNNTPVVVLSSSDEVKDIQDAYQAGCTTYITKPILVGEAWHELVNVIKQYWWGTSERPSS